MVYVEFPGAEWVVGNLPVGVYPLTPVSRTWIVNKHTKVKARRTGYFLVPDFASTAHMIQGQSLEASFADVVNETMFERATEELRVTAYVMLSRAKYLQQLWIMQAFGHQLFTRGPPLGPHLLLRKLRGEITANQALEEFEQHAEEAKEQVAKDPMARRFSCAGCFLSGRKDYQKPPVAFGATAPQTSQNASSHMELGRVVCLAPRVRTCVGRGSVNRICRSPDMSSKPLRKKTQETPYGVSHARRSALGTTSYKPSCHMPAVQRNVALASPAMSAREFVIARAARNGGGWQISVLSSIVAKRANPCVARSVANTRDRLRSLGWTGNIISPMDRRFCVRPVRRQVTLQSEADIEVQQR